LQLLLIRNRQAADECDLLLDTSALHTFYVPAIAQKASSCEPGVYCLVDDVHGQLLAGALLDSRNAQNDQVPRFGVAMERGVGSEPECCAALLQTCEAAWVEPAYQPESVFQAIERGIPTRLFKVGVVEHRKPVGLDVRQQPDVPC
jgi:hypothetical protein